jgi:hypothetical protein
MWQPKAFNDDDPRNKELADEMGVVMGSSHHEPMTRAQTNGAQHRQGRHRRPLGLRDQRRQPADLLARRDRADDVEGRRRRPSKAW